MLSFYLAYVRECDIWDTCFNRAIFKFPLTRTLMKSARAARTWFLLSVRRNNRWLNARSQLTWISLPGLDVSFFPCPLRILIENRVPARKHVPEVRNGRGKALTSSRNWIFSRNLNSFSISDSMRRKDVAGVAYFKSVDRTRRFNDYEKKFCYYTDTWRECSFFLLSSFM